MKIQTYKQPRIWTPTQQLEPRKIVDKETAHKEDLLHKSSHLLIVEDNYVFCRRRGDEEERYGGLLTTTFGTHVGLEETYLDTIRKHIQSAKKEKLFFVGEFRVHDEYENEVCGLYFIRRKEILPDIGGYQERKSFSELEKEISRQKTTPHLKEAHSLIKLIL